MVQTKLIPFNGDVFNADREIKDIVPVQNKLMQFLL